MNESNSSLGVFWPNVAPENLNAIRRGTGVFYSAITIKIWKAIATFSAFLVVIDFSSKFKIFLKVRMWCNCLGKRLLPRRSLAEAPLRTHVI